MRKFQQLSTEREAYRGNQQQCLEDHQWKLCISGPELNTVYTHVDIYSLL
ncbi:hypothetical protein [Sutcliffiella sp. FSL R7-0096]